MKRVSIPHRKVRDWDAEKDDPMDLVSIPHRKVRDSDEQSAILEAKGFQFLIGRFATSRRS